jgi:hypothetical protein
MLSLFKLQLLLLQLLLLWTVLLLKLLLFYAHSVPILKVFVTFIVFKVKVLFMCVTVTISFTVDAVVTVALIVV